MKKLSKLTQLELRIEAVIDKYYAYDDKAKKKQPSVNYVLNKIIKALVIK
jgi:hypothetical protein